MARKQKPSTPEVSFTRTVDFVSRYANNIRVEPYATDLKVLFGQSTQEPGKEVIEQHTAITLSWAQVKLAIYYLQVQLVVYEMQTGRPVMIHPVLMPAPFPEKVPDEAANDPHAEETMKRLRELREQFILESNR
jgi:hypothetical protein